MKFLLVLDEHAEEHVTATVHKESAFTEKLKNDVLHYNGEDTLTGYTENSMKTLYFADIECVYLSGGKTYAVDKTNQHFWVKYRLYELEERLPENFIRINKSALANKNRLDKLNASFNGSVDAVFKCGYTDYVSRRCLQDLKRRLGVK